ncbi:helix-turn-helix domain-containing protein [Carnobacterium divergens]|uniref:helix-turn-helix domain-containing protein n=1 Tax=Carnobacterium divergens TaxID=2748 RepID=UPI0028906A3F|nr:helix-turn-helix domain-containing protein [Carnobacterium divergens]MDT1997257.1 helix-turn-helix domain-containing protein [Carnobacterium divergens]
MYKKIKKLAKKKGVSIAQIERECDFSGGLLSKWDKSIPSADKLYKVAEYLDTTIEDLLKERK